MTAPGQEVTGISFSNDLRYTEALNPYTYRNFYNGGGVGIGDFDNDGLPDIYFTGNLVENRLYRNLGNFRFEDVTERAGVACPDSWSTGVSIADVNADGLADIYVCKAGPPAGERIDGMTGVRHNELFINRGDGTFAESASEYGLDVIGLSVHAAFFDYDGDGDLDCYLLNNSTRATTGYDLVEGLRKVPDPEGGNKLFRNLLIESGKTVFEDVTTAAGIYSSSIGFGLGVTVGDVDLDGRSDLFVSNDYFERDYLYYNNGDGTFREELVDHLPEISKGSMGADLADLNNDGLPELFVTEMLPVDERRYKTKAAFEGWNRYQLYRDRGYHQQFSRNVLQLNRGGGNFSEIGRMAGVEATDWSWGALLCDLDNDGYRDIFVANGTGKDLLDQDYINFNGNPAAIRRMIFQEGKGITDLIDQIPSEALTNAVFRNNGDLTFTDVAADWGLGQPTFSNGSAYADLDNDGDLDLVINNVDSRAGIYRNNTTVRSRMVALHSDQPGNPAAIGAELIAYGDTTTTYAQLHPMRGFQSTVDRRIHTRFGLDSIAVRWPDGRIEAFDLRGDSSAVTKVERGGGMPTSWPSLVPARDATGHSTYLLSEVSDQDGVILTSEDPAVDFDRDPLLFLGINDEGPALAAADLNGDGRTDLYVGGASGEVGRLLIATVDGSYTAVAQELFLRDAAAENVDAAFFDADGDGDLDLYVANGSNQFGAASTALFDILYVNEGSGRWSKSDKILPSSKQAVASSCVRAHDYDGDGDTDLFVGGRLKPGVYGVPTDSYLLENRGRLGLRAIPVPDLGMVTDARWVDFDGDGRAELAIAAEWSPLRYLYFDQFGGLTRIDTVAGTAGLWHGLAAADFDGDGRIDLAAGNHGLNSRLHASAEQPLRLYINDFDGNGKAEQILTRYTGDGRAYPLVLRDDLVKQLPGLRKSLSRYEDYQGKTMEELFPEDVLARSVVLEVTELRSLVVLNKTAGPKLAVMPAEAQLGPLYALQPIAPESGDTASDLLVGGNQSVGRPELGIYAGGIGLVLRNTGDGTFVTEDPRQTGLYIRGDIRGIVAVQTRQTTPDEFILARSGGTLLKLKIQTE